MAYEDDSQDYQEKPKDKYHYRKKKFIHGKWRRVGTPIPQPEPYIGKGGVLITGEHEPGGGGSDKKKGRKKSVARQSKSHGGGVGIQTHGNKLAKPLNTQTPDHSVYLNEDNYLKGGIKIRS